MTKASRYLAAALIACAAIVPAAAQFPDPPDNTPAGEPKCKKGPGTRAGPDVNGTWAGELTQIGSSSPYKFEIAITANKLETKYPDLNCIGKLTRTGSSKSYAFFIEVITQGQVDKGGRCPDGTITVARSGDKLAVGWFGSVKENTIVAYGTLVKK